MTKQDLFNFINSKIHTVISTCGTNHAPEAAVIGFGQTQDLELIFGTFKTSRKYKNLQQNPQVAFVIGWDKDYITVQYEGTATELEGQELETLVSLFHQKVPSAAHYKSHPDQTYFKVTPTWIRYSDLSGEDEKITELKL
jgi:uncharacterized pyridoxamine 5'-phosphate oxidase family protein